VRFFVSSKLLKQCTPEYTERIKDTECTLTFDESKENISRFQSTRIPTNVPDYDMLLTFFVLTMNIDSKIDESGQSQPHPLHQ
jgi:hypothetical protein